MSTYVVGDVQGGYTELLHLLQDIHFDPGRDRLWFAGDLVNRGPHSLEVLRFLSNMDPAPIVVLGNHDLHFLAVALVGASRKKEDTLGPLLEADDAADLIDWLRRQYLCYYDEQHDIFLSHAGLYPAWSLETALACGGEVQALLSGPHYQEVLEHMYGQEPASFEAARTPRERYRFTCHALTRMRYVDANGHLNLKHKGPVKDAPSDLIPWFRYPKRQYRGAICFGHWASLNGATQTPNVYALDYGCAWGRFLAAMRLEDGALYKVPSSIRAKETS